MPIESGCHRGIHEAFRNIVANSVQHHKHQKRQVDEHIVFLGISGIVLSMRGDTAKTIIERDSAAAGEMLTTGEAARVLNSSRQHVVDLCNRGDLPFVTVGTHRRVRRADVESLRDRTLRLTRDQRRGLWLAFAVGGRIAADPEAARVLALRNLATMRQSARGQAVFWLEEWGRLLDGPIADLLIALTSRSPLGRDLRQNAPFAGLLSEAERSDVIASWKAHDGRRSSA